MIGWPSVIDGSVRMVGNSGYLSEEGSRFCLLEEQETRGDYFTVKIRFQVLHVHLALF